MHRLASKDLHYQKISFQTIATTTNLTFFVIREGKLLSSDKMIWDGNKSLFEFVFVYKCIWSYTGLI